MINVATQKARLLARLKELDDRLHKIDDELESHHSRDWEELAVERETDEVLEGMGLSGQAEMLAIQTALQRIDAGEYGACVSCGEAISPERLDVLPYTPLCQKCAHTRKAS